jgi:Mrp family chromosome partitioning ATPase
LPLGTSTRIYPPVVAVGEPKAQRPSFLPSWGKDDAKQRQAATSDAGAAAPVKAEAMPAARAEPIEAKAKTEAAKPASPPTAPIAAAQTFDSSPSEASAAGFINRLRRGLSSSQGEPVTPPPQPEGGWLTRLRVTKPLVEQAAVEDIALVTPQPHHTMPVLRTNDLRAYLNQRLTGRSEPANDSVRKADAPQPKGDDEKVGPVLKSLDAVINHILASGKGGAPRAVLVAGAASKVDATAEAIGIARALVARRERIVLVDLTRGPAAISSPLGIPRAPGLSDLTAGRVGFSDVIRVDVETPLQVIAAGNPKLAASGDENTRFGRVFDALTQAYDCVVLHADREAVRVLTPALKFELPVVVAVLPAGTSAKGDKASLGDFSALGCPVLVYEQPGKEPRSRLLGRVAAV